MQDDQVEPQDPDLRNSPIGEEDGEPSAGDRDCYWNGQRHSDGATVCSSGRRMRCWSGKWVDIGNC